MMHLTEEEMMEQVYGESENATAVERHLAACRECAHNFAELQRDLAALDRVEAPTRDARYGERVWASIAPLLPTYQLEKRRWWSSGWIRGLSVAGRLRVLRRTYLGTEEAAARCECAAKESAGQAANRGGRA